jgi:hypothetical protein
MYESDLNQYFGETNLGTGYLFIYSSSQYTSQSLIKSMTPDGWKAPVNERTVQLDVDQLGDPEPKPILATQEIEDEEEGDSTPRIKSIMKGGKEKKIVVDLTIVKRPSLPALSVDAYSSVSPGPATSFTAEPPKTSWFSKKDKKSNK